MADYGYEEDLGVIQPPAEDDEVPPYARYTSGEGPPLVLSAEEFFRSSVPRAPAPVTTPVTDEGPPLVMTPDEFFSGPGTASRTGAFLRGAAEGALPGVAGLGGGVLAGAGAGAALSGPLAPAGALVGGVIGGLATGYGAAKLQDWVLDALGMREGTGTFSRRQRQTDEALFPYSRFAGEMAPAALMLRPGGNLVERGISGAIGGGVGAVADYYETGKVDPAKVAMGAALGAALPNLNRPSQQAINRITPRAWQPPAPPAPPLSEGFTSPGAYPALPQDARQYHGELGPRAPSEMENMVSAARAQRDSFDPLVEPDLYKYWSWHHAILNERLNSSRAGNADVETQASQGVGPPSTPRGTDLANDVTTVSPGVAAENRPVRRPEAGNPTGAPMFNREAARPSSAERAYGKQEVPDYPGIVTQPSTKIATDPIAADIRAALGGWETTRSTAPVRAVEGALARGVEDVNRAPAAAPAPAPVPAPAPAAAPAPAGPPAVRSWNDVRAEIMRPRTPPAPEAAPAAPEAPPVPDAHAAATSFVDRLIGQTGGDANNAYMALTDLLRNNPAFQKDPVMMASHALLASRVAPEARAATVAAPVTPTAPAAAGRAAAAPAAAPDAAVKRKAPVPAADLSGRRGPSPEAADLASKILTQNGNNPVDALGAVEAMVKQVPALKENPHVAEAHDMLQRMVASAPKPAPPPATQAAIAKSKAAAPKAGSPAQYMVQTDNKGNVLRSAKYSLDEFAKWREERPNDSISFSSKAAAPQAPAAAAPREKFSAMSPRAREIIARNRALETVAPARPAPVPKLPPAAQAAVEGRKPATAPVTKNVSSVTKPEGAPPQAKSLRRGPDPNILQRIETMHVDKEPPPAAKAAIAKSKKTMATFTTKPDPVASMTPEEQAAMAGAYGIDAKDPSFVDKLRAVMKDTGGAIDIGPAEPDAPRPRFSANFVRGRIEDLKGKFLNLPGTFLADSFAALTRGSHSWALQVTDDFINRNPGLYEQKPAIADARRILAERAAEETPASVAAEVDIPGPKAPRERMVEQEPEPLPGLPTQAIIRQIDKKGLTVREAPFDPEKAAKWREELPGYRVVSLETNIRRPSTPRFEEPETPVEPARVRTGQAGEAPPPGERTPRIVFDPITGEPRETKVWRPEEAIAEEKPATPAETGPAEFDMDTTGKLLRVLPEAEQLRLIEQMQSSTPAEFNAAARQLWENHLRFAETRNRLSTGVLVQGEADRAHKQAVIDANERAFAAHPLPDKQETNKETIARATAMVTAAENDIKAQITELKGLHPEFKEFTGQYTPKVKPAGTAMLMAARQLLRDRNLKKFRSSEALIGRGTDPDTGAQLVRETERVAGDVTKQTYKEAGDVVAPENTSRPEYDTVTYPNDPARTEQHQILTDTLNAMDTKTHDLLYDTWAVPLDMEVASTKEPVKLLSQIIEHLSDIARQKNEVALSFREPGETPVRRYTYEGPLSKAEVEEITGRPQRYYKHTEPGAKAGEARKIEPGSLEFVQTAEEALAKFGTVKRPPREPGAVGDLPTRRSALEAVANQLGVENIKGSTEELSKRILQHGKRAVKDTSGSLDVTGIFNFIDRMAKKFRPDREPMVPTGMTRLYKADGEAKWSTDKSFMENMRGLWRDESGAINHPGLPRAEQAMQLRREGKTFGEIGTALGVGTERARQMVNSYDSKKKAAELYGTPRQELNRFLNKTEAAQYVDVPTSALDQYRIDGVSGATGKAADRFAKKWDDTFDLDKAGPDKRVVVEPEDVPVTDFLRKLWHDENGALDITSLPQWIPNARNKLHDFFSSKADPAALEYGKNIGGDFVSMRNRITRGMRDWIYNMRKAVLPDGEPPTWVERGQMLRAFEDRKIDALPPRLRDYWKEHVQPRLDDTLKAYNDVRDIMLRNEFPGYKKMVEPVDNGEGYVPFMFRRRKKDFENPDEFDPILSRNSMALWAQSIEPREWFSFQQDGTKARRLYRVADDGDIMIYKDGRVIAKLRSGEYPEGFDPQQVGSRVGDMVVDNARTSEISAHGNEEGGKKPRYMEDPLLVISDAYAGLLRMRERAKFVEQLVRDPRFAENSAPNKTQAEKKWGEGNVAETILPHFKNRWFPKPVAWALDDAVKMGFDYNGNRFMEGLARFNQAALKPFYFLGPEVHVFNELDKFLVGRGYENLNLPKTFRNFAGALKSVRNQDGLQTEIMEAGGNPMFAHSMVSRFVPNMARILKSDFQERPWKYDPIRRVFGYDVKPKWEHVYQESNKMMWWQSDVLYTAVYNDMKQRFGGKDYQKKYDELQKLQKVAAPTADQVTRRNELDAWNKDLAKTAVHEAEKIIDSYIVPTTFGKSVGLEGSDAGRAFQQFLTDPATANFGRFSYGLYKTLANVAKNMAGKNENMSTPASMALGFSQAGMLLLMANVVYPYLSKAYQQAPWAKPDSEVEKRGVTSIASIPGEIAHKGIKDGWSKFARRIWSPAVAPNLALTAYENRDNVGRPIIESSGGFGKVPGQAAEHALGQIVSPAGQFSRAAGQGGADFALLRFLESNFGVKTPSDAQTRYEARREAEQLRLAKSRERHPRGALEMGGNYLSDTLRRAVRGYEHGGVVPTLPGR